MVEQEEDSIAELRRALRRLAHDKGVWQENLLDLLRGELRSLQMTWQVNLNSESDAVRRIIEAQLAILITQLTPPRSYNNSGVEDHGKRYAYGVMVSFNVSSPDTRSKGLEQRRAWLAKDAPRHLQTKTRTSRRDFDQAIVQMATLLARADYMTADVVTADHSSPPHPGEEEQSAAEGQDEETAVVPGDPSASSTIERLARRTAIELRALRALLARTIPRVGRAVKRRALWITVTTSVAIIVAYPSGLLMGKLTGNPPWFGPFRPLASFYYEHNVPIVIVLALLAAGVIPWSIFLRRGKMIACITASLLVLHEGLVGAAIIARDQELESIDKLYAEVATWSQDQMLRFEGKPIEGDPYKDICKEFKPLLPFGIANKLVMSKLAVPYGEELHGDLCASGHGDVILRSGMDSNSLPGNKAQDHDARVYAQTLVRPSLGTLWSDCGMLAVPGYRTEGKSILAFGLEVTDGAKVEYRPIISLITLEEEKVVARSAVTIPMPDEIGRFFDEPRDGWLKFGVHRTGSTYNFYVNNREVVSYTLVDDEKWIHMSLVSRVGTSRLGRAIAECRFDDFRYWTQPVSKN